jgi:hypothetical protein
MVRPVDQVSARPTIPPSNSRPVNDQPMNARHLRMLLWGAERIAPDAVKDSPLVVVVEQTLLGVVVGVRIDADRGLVLDAISTNVDPASFKCF